MLWYSNRHQEDLWHFERPDISEDRDIPTTQDKSGKCLINEQHLLKSWSEYCSEMYNYMIDGVPVLVTPQRPLKTTSLWCGSWRCNHMSKTGKSTGIDKMTEEQQCKFGGKPWLPPSQHLAIRCGRHRNGPPPLICHFTRTTPYMCAKIIEQSTHRPKSGWRYYATDSIHRRNIPSL